MEIHGFHSNPWVQTMGQNFRPKPDAGADHVFVQFEKK
jgi:hypothetical protein